MNFFPGSDRILEEAIELFGLANALFVSKEAQGHLSTHSYLAKELANQRGQARISTQQPLN